MKGNKDDERLEHLLQGKAEKVQASREGVKRMGQVLHGGAKQ